MDLGRDDIFVLCHLFARVPSLSDVAAGIWECAMTDSIISVRNLHKAYRVYSHPSKMVAEVLTGRPRHREFVALENINFDVQPGTVVGLLGRNGAGKSTLLRIVARTLDASSGT